MKSIVVCADDYGMSDKVDGAILDLIAHQRISATSCMTLMPNWTSSAKALTPLKDKAATGLHFDLGAHDSLKNLMLKSCLGRHDLKALRQTLDLQLDRFEDELNCPPDYLDGHQHVHAFPQVRQVIVERISERYSEKKPWVRNPIVPFTGHDSLIKALVIRALNIGFASSLAAAKLPSHSSFAGLYSIDESADFPTLMEGWIENLGEKGVIMCHPAAIGSTDEHGSARVKEYQYLSSERYAMFLRDKAIKLSKLD
ncbi:ChbG/HpnK family deacetylase [Vibrio sp. SCSIO 43136]|uniref:ChbG/HpnK family deacetylase n=1 Tax=Vibrio sp. SCSIO 43136 TaxID=2819101 RepID=UPI002075CA54|nr:ChbG/HpnK family deacetylase [Vibrio sp. SCSIO 43136]USD66223.1 ChbG/HpnK family deacetylase [Vibrio sp. SCSIO 43136]